MAVYGYIVRITRAGYVDAAEFADAYTANEAIPVWRQVHGADNLEVVEGPSLDTVLRYYRSRYGIPRAPIDAKCLRVLRADPGRWLLAAEVGERAGCGGDSAGNALRALNIGGYCDRDGAPLKTPRYRACERICPCPETLV